MRFRLEAVAVVALISTGSSNSMAGWPEMKHAAGIDRERNNCWPQPFRSMDAAAVYAPFDVMKSNGWRLHNTMGTCFFTDQQALTDAGRIRLDWIIHQAPQDRRQVFVMRGATSEATAARVEAVQLAISDIVPVGELPQIYVTDVEPTVSSGQYQTAVSRNMQRAVPQFRLPTFKGLNNPTAGTSSSGGGGGGGSSSGK